jgi:hypothetical protein
VWYKQRKSTWILTNPSVFSGGRAATPDERMLENIAA